MRYLRSLYFKLKRPFQTITYIHDSSKIVVRQFPFIFKVTTVPSLQSRIDDAVKAGGGTVRLEPAIFLIKTPIVIPSTAHNLTIDGGGHSILDGSMQNERS